MSEPLSWSVMFLSERFDYRSELPAEYNAGNRFYGKDLAEFLGQALTRAGFASESLDEDWGWLVSSTPASPLDFHVAVYNLAEHGEGGRPGVGEWGLWVQAHEMRKWLGLLPKRTEVTVPQPLREAVRRAIESAGAELLPWDDAPDSATD